MHVLIITYNYPKIKVKKLSFLALSFNILILYRVHVKKQITD